jgi:class 3 adenylate cyclase/HAMP domain-containing protein
MRIRSKIIFVVLPILVATVILVGVSSYFSAAAGINRIARDFLGFKVLELQKYADSQYQLLVDNNFTGKPEMVQATKGSIEVFARSLLQSPSELILTISPTGELASATGEISLRPGEGAALAERLKASPDDLLSPVLGGTPRVAKGFYFKPYDWYYVVSETQTAFFSDIQAIAVQTAVILAAALTLAGLLLFFFAGTLTRPLRDIVAAMKDIISSGDLGKQVDVEYADETGELAHTFNIMLGQLDASEKSIKKQALEAVLAKRNEQRLRTIFQKYVPQKVIDQFVGSPEKMLVGEKRDLSILFSDIRSFTSISEGMDPYELVQNLNRYFTQQVDIVMARNGTVDKYIGDAIMAFWGAPEKRDDDALQSVLAGIEMNEAVREFNKAQTAAGRPEFRIGIGINYGEATVGNMGSEKKLNYTVIGDNVNLASRMEGLTKEFHQTLLISENLRDLVAASLPTRLLATVAVKGKSQGVRIYTVERSLGAGQAEGWRLHNQAMDLFYARRFRESIDVFDHAEKYLPGDFCLDMTRHKAKEFIHAPPGEDWDGVLVMEHK